MDVTDLEALMATLGGEIKLTVVTKDYEFDGVDDLLANMHSTRDFEEIRFRFLGDSADAKQEVTIGRYSVKAAFGSRQAERAASAVEDFLLGCPRFKHPWVYAVLVWIGLMSVLMLAWGLAYNSERESFGASAFVPGGPAIFGSLPWIGLTRMMFGWGLRIASFRAGEQPLSSPAIETRSSSD